MHRQYLAIFKLFSGHPDLASITLVSITYFMLGYRLFHRHESVLVQRLSNPFEKLLVQLCIVQVQH